VQGEAYPIDDVGGEIEMRACSACAGDYEDPDRTAWMQDEEAQKSFLLRTDTRRERGR
jgi:hypothetical protein